MSADSKINGFLPFFYLAFIIYGSLIPFHFKSIPIQDAFRIFTHIRYLDLGLASRADWVANILLYIPFGFLLTGFLSFKPASISMRYIVPAVFCIIICILTSVTIEFFQIFFAPRTVSLNDLVAEGMGSFIGVMLWIITGPGLVSLWKRANSHRGAKAGLSAFLVIYLLSLSFLMLFPFDFLVSVQEIKIKYASLNLFALHKGVSLFFLIKLAAEILLFIPVGLILAFLCKDLSLSQKIGWVFIFSLLMSFFIEITQFFTVSGKAWIPSIPLRITGAVLGVFISENVKKYSFKRFRPLVQYGLLFAVPVYGWVVLRLSGWSLNDWLSFDDAFLKLDVHMLLPFYYHYFSSETRAVFSVLSNCGLYSPVGLACWLLSVLDQGHQKRYFLMSVVIVTSFSCIIEAGKLFQTGLHPDFTNILIAVASSVIIFKFMNLLLPVFQDEHDT